VGKPAGYGYTDTTDKAILVSIDPATLLGTYDETNFQRFDLVLADACKLSTLYNMLCKVNTGCFWHGHLCKFTAASHIDFWLCWMPLLPPCLLYSKS